jgi:hypothetical protein
MLVDRSWNELASASGHCGHIPEALVGLRDASAAARHAARWRIDNYVVLQGELYEGAPWVVRELVRDLLTDAHPGKPLVYDLLIEFALADAPGKVVHVGGQDTPLVDLTRAEIRAGRSIYVRDSTNADAAVAGLARDLLEEVDSWNEPEG